VKTISDLIERNALCYPDKCAVALDGGRRLSYREFAQRVRLLASALYKLGLRQQDRVGCLSMNSLEYVELYGACEWAGYIAAAYNFRSAAPEVAFLLADSQPKVVFFESQYAPMLAALRADFPEIQHYVCMDAPAPQWAISFEDLVAGGDPQGPPFRAQPQDYTYLFYTSGTTGRPKGVPWSQRGALDVARLCGRLFDTDITYLQTTPLFHTGGKTNPLGAMWLAGTTIVQRRFDPAGFLKVVEHERVTDTFMVAQMIQAVLDVPAFPRYDLSSLRGVVSAAAPIPLPLLRRALEAFGPAFYMQYGSTEGACISQLSRHELRPDGSTREVERLRSVGHFLPELEGAILNEELEPCAAGVVGEVCLKSIVFEGYWNNTIATLEATRGGWFHSGDLGYADDEGFIFLVDRIKDMIISGGENIYSREVEEALALHAGVLETAVIGVPDEKWGEAVKALVVLRSGHAATEGELIEHCRSQIARYKCPRSIAFVEALPRLGTGKIDKVGIRRQHSA